MIKKIGTENLKPVKLTTRMGTVTMTWQWSGENTIYFFPGEMLTPGLSQGKSKVTRKSSCDRRVSFKNVGDVSKGSRSHLE